MTLAVDRRIKKESEGQQADFISCVAFGKTAEFLGKYGTKGTKFVVTGRIQTGSYTNREGVKVYTTDVVIEEVEFAESKGAAENHKAAEPKPVSTDENGFMNIPDGIDEELPFS